MDRDPTFSIDQKIRVNGHLARASECRMRAWRNTAGEYTVLLSQLPKPYTGASVTNVIELLVKQARSLLWSFPEVDTKARITYIEHYSREARGNDATFDLVTIGTDGRPTWGNLVVVNGKPVFDSVIPEEVFRE